MKLLIPFLSLILAHVALAAQEPAELSERRQAWETQRTGAQAKVDKLYLEELEELKKNYLKAGNLEGAVATQNEIDQNGKNTKDPAGLSKLRKSYKKSVEVSRKKLFESYYEDLEKLKQQYMSEANLNSSISVDKEMKRVVDTYKKSQPPKPSRVKKYNKTDSFKGFEMEFAVIGNPGNTKDKNGYGAVPYTYRICKHEVSVAMIDAYNKHSGGPTITMDTRGADKPATKVSWNEAARFINWLNTSQGYQAAYKFTTDGANDNIVLWTAGEVGYDASNPYRNSGARYFLPSEDEWYKAAYYDPNHGGAGVGGYWEYATGSDKAPTPATSGTKEGTAVYSRQRGPANITNAGGLSSYGTMAQNGNALEWCESAKDGGNDLNSVSRVCRLRGGSWNSTPNILQSSFRINHLPERRGIFIGFRVAAVPE